MNLENKKELASRVLGVGKGRIFLNPERREDIKEAITRQDIRDLKEDGAIKVKDKKGRKKNVERKTKRREGKVKKTINKRKEEYVNSVRKQRKYLKRMKEEGEISREEYWKLRNDIKMRKFKDLSRLKKEVEGEE